MSSANPILGNFPRCRSVDYLSTGAGGTFSDALFSNSLELCPICISPTLRNPLEQANAVE